MLAEARALEAPLRGLSRARRVAPLLYFELTGLDGAHDRSTSKGFAACRTAVASVLHEAVGSLLRRDDAVVAGPASRWYAALLLGRAVPARSRAAVSDADLGLVANRLRAAIQARLDAIPAAHAGDTRRERIGVRAGWTIIEPRDGERPLAELRHAIRGAAVVGRIEERRATVLAAITHELRTPLTSIIGFVEQLRDGRADAPRNGSPRRDRALAIVADEARRLSRLVEGLIDAGAWQAGSLNLRRRRVELRPLAGKAQAMLDEHARARGIAIVVRGKARANVDADRVLQVIVNALDNAVRHAKRRAGVRLGTHAGTASITVTDDGPGFERGLEGRLGSPFGTGSNGRVGLGLAIASMLVTAHGGRIAFDGRRGGGARVTISIPS